MTLSHLTYSGSGTSSSVTPGVRICKSRAARRRVAAPNKTVSGLELGSSRAMVWDMSGTTVGRGLGSSSNTQAQNPRNSRNQRQSHLISHPSERRPTALRWVDRRGPHGIRRALGAPGRLAPPHVVRAPHPDADLGTPSRYRPCSADGTDDTSAKAATSSTDATFVSTP
jgi:hypothetical protein